MGCPQHCRPDRQPTDADCSISVTGRPTRDQLSPARAAAPADFAQYSDASARSSVYDVAALTLRDIERAIGSFDQRLGTITMPELRNTNRYGDPTKQLPRRPPAHNPSCDQGTYVLTNFLGSFKIGFW